MFMRRFWEPVEDFMEFLGVLRCNHPYAFGIPAVGL